MPLRFNAIHSDAGYRDVGGIVDIGLGAYRKPPAQHRSIARRSGDGQDQGVGLQRANPHGIETLIENSEGREKPSGGDSHVGTCDVVGLEVVEMLIHRAAEWPASRRTLELALKLAPGFHQPAVAERQKENRINLRIEERLARSHAGKKPGRSAKDGNRLFRRGGLRGRASRRKEYENKQPRHPRQSNPPPALETGSCVQTKQPLTPRKAL